MHFEKQCVQGLDLRAGKELQKPMGLWLVLLVVGSNQQVLGFLGESVTLSPALDVTQRNISSIKWLILSNDTWIATYQGGITNTNHFWQYRGRLNLDISSGVCVCTVYLKWLDPLNVTDLILIKNICTDRETYFEKLFIKASTKLLMLYIKVTKEINCIHYNRRVSSSITLMCCLILFSRF